MQNCGTSTAEGFGGSFRDPSGRVIVSGDQVIRLVNREGTGDLFAVLSQPAFESVYRHRFDIVPTQHVEGTKRWLYVLRKRATWEAR